MIGATPTDQVSALRTVLGQVYDLIERVDSLYDEAMEESCSCGSDPEGVCLHCAPSMRASERLWHAMKLIDLALITTSPATETGGAAGVASTPS